MTENAHSQELKRSTAMLLSISLGGIAAAALVAILVAMMVAETLQGDASAINLAGSMRMQSYRILAARLNNAPSAEMTQHTLTFERKLRHPILQVAIHSNDDTELLHAIGQLNSAWYSRLKPMLTNPAVSNTMLTHAIDFYVESIDQVVQKLQQLSEAKIRILRNVQIISLLTLFFLSALLLYAVHSKWVAPLKEFMSAVGRLKQGDFGTRIQYQNDDELGLLGNTINQMAGELATVYCSLERRVEEKTRQLQLSNESLRVLYENSRLLFANPDDLYSILPAVLNDLQKTTQLDTISLCLRKEESGPSFKLFTSDGSKKPRFCRMPDCDNCRKQPDKTVFAPHLSEVCMFPVISGDTHFGDISIELHPGQHLTPWQHHLICAMAEIVGTTQSLAQASQQHSRIALMEERAAIARELHDSLAQTLSYQKLQASRLRKLLEKSASQDQQFDAINEVQEGLNSAYRQLRELIGTFRISVTEPGFKQAVIDTVADLSKKQNLEIQLDYNIAHCPLTPNEETHCLHIIREALNNVVKHAQASKACVQLQQLPFGHIQIRIEDNGIGIPTQPHKADHYGLSILSERSSHLHGHLDIGRPSQGGTLVCITFEPNFLSNKNFNNKTANNSHVTENRTDRISG